MAMANFTEEQTQFGDMFLTFSESLAAASNGSTLIIPANLKHLAVSIKATGGAKLQVTMDPISVIQAGTETYFDWPDGVVTAETDMKLSPAIRGLRLVQTAAGTSSIKVGASR